MGGVVGPDVDHPERTSVHSIIERLASMIPCVAALGTVSEMLTAVHPEGAKGVLRAVMPFNRRCGETVGTPSLDAPGRQR